MLLIGSEFFGLIGMFLAAPVAAIVRVLIQYYVIRPQFRRFGPPDTRFSPRPRTEDLEIDRTALAAHGSHSGAH